MASDLKKRKISSQAYQLMVTGGIFTEEDKIELLDGEIIEMSPVGSVHNGIIYWLNQFLTMNLKLDAIISVQCPIHLGEYSEPEPDLAICKPKDHYYRNHLAKAEDIILLIEVSDTTLKKDQKVKLPLYAEAGIQTYWIVNLVEKQVEVYTNPKEKKYDSKNILSGTDMLKLSEFGLEFSIKEMFGQQSR